MADYTSTTSMPAWAQPYAEGYLGRAQQVADQPYQGYGGDRVAGFTPWQEQGYKAQAQRAADGSPIMGAAQTALQGQFGGQQPGATVNPYATENNPYLTSQIDQAQGDVVRSWNQVQMPGFDTAMQRGGSFGNANVQGMASQGASDLQRNLGDISSRMRFQDHTQRANLAESFAGRNDSMVNSGRAATLQALGLAPAFAASDYTDIDRLTSAGGAFQKQNQMQLDDAYGRFTEQRDYPQKQLDVFGRALGGVNPGSTTTNSGPGQNPIATAAGGALTFAQLWKLFNEEPK